LNNLFEIVTLIVYEVIGLSYPLRRVNRVLLKVKGSVYTEMFGTIDHSTLRTERSGSSKFLNRIWNLALSAETFTVPPDGPSRVNDGTV
jgi:hypothetical protein